MTTDFLPQDGLILCAVSGGADSMYLLCRLAELGYAVAAGHYNHGLRGDEADRDERFVRDFCQSRNIPFLSEKGDVRAWAEENGLGIEEAARTCRYGFLERAADALGAAVIATAHTANDNAETLLLNLARGAGLKGLGGIPPVRGHIVRPMLDVTRNEVEAYLRGQGISYIEDSSNSSDIYSRNRVRHGAVPVLESVNPAFLRAAGQTAELLRADEVYLSELAEIFLEENSDGNSLPASVLVALPWPVASRVVRRMAGRELSLCHVKSILKAARDGGAADVPGLRVARGGDRLVFGPEKGTPIPLRTLPVPGELEIPEAGMTVKCNFFPVYPQLVHKSFNIFFFQCDNICGSITVAGRMPADRFRPAGRGCTKTLKQLFQEQDIPPWQRDSVPVLRDDAGILGVCGIGAAERVEAKPGDKNILQIEFIRREPDGGGSGYES